MSIIGLSDELVTLDSEIIDFYRVPPEPGGGPNIDPQFFVIQMSLRESVRESVLRHVREANQTLNDLQIRVLTKATLIVSVCVLVVTIFTLMYDVSKDANSTVIQPVRACTPQYFRVQPSWLCVMNLPKVSLPRNRRAVSL
jgi:hypothetical protein